MIYERKDSEHTCIAGKLVGLLSIADAVKADANEVVDALNDMRLHVVLLTGDNERTAKAIADQVWYSSGTLSYCY